MAYICVMCGFRLNSRARGNTAISSVSFHRFPKQPDLREKWAMACKLRTTDINEQIRICSKHFKLDDFYETVEGRRLLPTAVPAPFTNYRTQKEYCFPLELRVKLERLDENEYSSENNFEKPCGSRNSDSSDMEENGESKISIFEHQLFDSDDDFKSMPYLRPMVSPYGSEDLRVEYMGVDNRNLDSIMDDLKSQKMQVKVLQRQKLSLEKYISDLKNLIRRLFDNKIISEQVFSKIMSLRIPNVLSESVEDCEKSNSTYNSTDSANDCLPLDDSRIKSERDEVESLKYTERDDIVADGKSSTFPERLEPAARTKNIKKRKDYGNKKMRCKFCDKVVISRNFVRHLVRHHNHKKEVKSALKLPLKSKERKQALSRLKNDKNYGLYLKGIIRPKRRRYEKKNTEYYPCVYCKPIYIKSFLVRHSRICARKKLCSIGGNTVSKINHVAPSQTVEESALNPTDITSNLDINEQDDSYLIERKPHGVRRAENHPNIQIERKNQFVNEKPVVKSTFDDDHEENITGPIETPKNPTSSQWQLDNKTASKHVKTSSIRNYCYFCETKVSHFARHVTRHHPKKAAVSEILSQPVKSLERKRLLDKLRRKGNFFGNRAGYLKPVRQTSLPERSLSPCDNCLGVFSSNFLYRHRKKCLNSGGDQVAGVSKLIGNLKVDRRLKKAVFPHMRSDEVSVEAKTDYLICDFGTRYLNAHRERRFVAVTSRKMRELAKMLIELRKLEPNITDMFSALRPKYFDLFVKATKILASYDSLTDVYSSPTFAMTIVTSLKQCCDIAMENVLMKHAAYLSVSTGDVESDLKTLIHLFESKWRFEISTRAANNLSINKTNKITVVSLANDLKLLTDHLIELAEKALIVLRENNSPAAYNNLVESVYCRVILLNRARSGELQRMLLRTYKSSLEAQGNDEFNRVVSPIEKLLSKTPLKIVVITGNRGRDVPVLFSNDVQNHIKVLLEVRQHFVPNENPYLFARATSAFHIIGYETLAKFTKCCGVKIPLSITSTRLKKLVATLSQLFNLSENEIEHFATFMGYTLGVPKDSYSFSDDLYQMAKISKLLIVMEKGGTDQFKGMSLNEVNIDMEEDLLNNNDVSDESDSEDILDENKESNDSKDQVLYTDIDVTQPGIKRGKFRVLVPWTAEQKTVTNHFFKNHIKSKKPPKRIECEDLKSKYPDLLQNKNWLKIKVFIQNEYTKRKRP